MIDPDTGQPHTAHTTLPVPFVLDCQDQSISLQKTGKLADIAPTILSFLGISQPVEMSGEDLLIRMGS
jgi:2,3-bisphosphoglycerate-independent phosphoglycerate mutase